MNNRSIGALALAFILGVMILAAQGDAKEYQQSVLAYCEGVAVFEADKARGVPLDRRLGHRDWDERIDVSEQCPGMRPAAPAITTQQRHIVSQ